jgi:microcystin-dependent protein
MAESFLGEIRMFAGNFAPAGWMFCAGQQVPIVENDALFNLIGTTYGGDGQQTFALPDLRGRIPIHMGGGFAIGQPGGVEEVTLNVQQIPSHSHLLMASNDTANSPNPGNNVLARSPQLNMFSNTTPSIPMSSQFLSPTGGSQAHDNFQPYLCVSFIISMFGIFPPPN